MRQIYTTIHNIMCQYHLYAFTGQGASNSSPVCNSFKIDYPFVRPYEKKIRLETLLEPPNSGVLSATRRAYYHISLGNEFIDIHAFLMLVVALR